MRRMSAAALVGALVLIAAGVALAVHGWFGGRAGPVTVVRRYYAALQRGDASAALAYGTVPPGSQALVSDAALAVQQHMAPLRHLVVVSSRTTGTSATVDVGYDLDFAGGAVTVADDVALHRVDGVWSLDASAVVTRFGFTAAAQRATIAGQRVPTGRALAFPGAIALRFDSPDLSGTAGNGYLGFGDPTTRVDVTLTAGGRRAAAAGVLTALRQCLRDGGDVTCPQPDGRYLPGSLRGTLDGSLHDPRIVLTTSPVGLVSVEAQATARVRYRRLDFTDELQRGHGTVHLEVQAETVAASPSSVRWTS